MGSCQNYGPFLDPYYNTAPNIYLGYPKRDHNFDNHPCRGYMDGCQNYDPFLGTLNIRCRIITGIQKGTIILTTTHIGI